MADFNSFTFEARLIEDLNITPATETRGGYARARVASNGFTDAKTLWMTVFFPEEVIGRIYQKVKKGTKLIIVGRLSPDNYKDKNGNDRQGLTVNAVSADFASLPPRENDGQSQAAADGTEELPF